MNYNFFLLVANDATGSSPEQLDQYYEEMIKKRLKNCKNPLVTETVIEQFRKNILKRLFVEELNLTLTPPIVFSSHLIAEKYIKVAFSGFKVIIDPNQSILSTSKLAVIVKLIPVGVLREVTVSIGFKIKIEE